MFGSQVSPEHREDRSTSSGGSQAFVNRVPVINGRSGSRRASRRPARLKKGDKLMWTKGKLLGEGAHGAVFLGLESTSGTLVAVKELRFDPDDESIDLRLASLQTELRVLKKFDHPNVVGYFSCAREANTFLMFLEYVAGGSLLSVREQFGPMQEPLAANFAGQILTGLQYLHTNGIIHRDIKCANVLITCDGIAKIADFGSAHILGDSNTNAQGTAFWMAPEVIRCEPTITPAADIWSFGCTFLEMLTNEVPLSYIGNTFAVMGYVGRRTEEPVEIPRYYRSRISPAALEIIEACLQRDPRKRPSAATLLQHDFFAFLRPRNVLGGGSATPEQEPIELLASTSGISPGNSQGSEAQLRISTAPSKNSSSEIDDGIRDHLVRRALSIVPSEAVAEYASQGEVPTGVGFDANSLSSLETVSLTSRTESIVRSSTEVQSIIAASIHSMVQRSSTSRVELPLSEEDTHSLEEEPVISYVIEDDDEGVDSPWCSCTTAAHRRDRVMVPPSGGEVVYEVPQRSVNRLQAVFLIATSIVALVAIILTVTFTLLR